MKKSRIRRILDRIGLTGNRYLSFLYEYDKARYEQFSCLNTDNIETKATHIRVISHTIEKALSLPDCRPDFGKEKIKTLLSLYQEYSQSDGIKDNECLRLAESIIEVYAKKRQEKNLDVSFIPECFRNMESIGVSSGIMTLQKTDNLGFERIAKNRHSLRYYSSRNIALEDIFNVVRLAQTAPSACNRQSVRVFACVSDAKIQQIKSMHGGLNGFGNPKVIFVITADITLYLNEYERNTMYVDGGIFVMNMLYAMSEYGLASCPIIWGAEPHKDTLLRDLLEIPACYQIVSLIVGGYYPDTPYRVACSAKRDLSKVLKVVSE